MTTKLVANTGVDVRAATIREIIEAAADQGIAEAIREHGTNLTSEDRQLLLDLSPAEIDELVALSGQVSQLDAIAMDTNNNL